MYDLHTAQGAPGADPCEVTTCHRKPPRGHSSVFPGMAQVSETTENYGGMAQATARKAGNARVSQGRMRSQGEKRNTFEKFSLGLFYGARIVY